MKQKKLKTISLLAAMSILFTASACNPKNEEEKAGEIPTLTWYLYGTEQKTKDVVLDKVNEILPEKIGAKLDIQIIDAGSYDDKMRMILSSGKDFDLCYTADWTNDFITNVQKGGYMALDDLIKENAPKLLEAVPDTLFNAARVDGKIYAIPNLQVLFRQICLVFDKELTEKYNFDTSTVKSIKDIEPYLEILKKNEPNMYGFRPEGWESDLFTDPVYEEILPSTGCLIKKDGSDTNIVVNFETPEFEDCINTYRDWYQKGYIRPDIDSVMDESSEMKAGKFGVTISTYKPGAEQEYKKQYKRDCIMVPIEDTYLNANAGMASMTAISRTSKNADKAIKLIELMYTDPEMLNLLSFGIEGQHYTKVNGGKIKINWDAGYNVAAWMIGNQFNAMLTEKQEDDIWEKTEQMNKDARVSPISGFTLNTQPIKTQLSAMSTVQAEYKSIYFGSQDLNGFFDEYKAKMKEAGIYTVRDEIQKQVNEYLSKK